MSTLLELVLPVLQRTAAELVLPERLQLTAEIRAALLRPSRR